MKEVKHTDHLTRLKLAKDNVLSWHRHTDVRNTPIYQILLTRQKELNSKFVWSQANKDKIAKMSDRLNGAVEQAHCEALATADMLEKRIENANDYLSDYEIEICINPYLCNCDPDVDETDEAKLRLALSETPSEMSVCYRFGHSSYARETNEPPVLLSKSLNWNGEYFNKEMDEHFIGYAMHILIEQSLFAWQDILDIQYIHSDIKVCHQSVSQVDQDAM